MEKKLIGVRVISAINGVELFGHERGNIEVFKTLRDLGAKVTIGVNALPNNNVDIELKRLGFSTFKLPFEAQWSIQRVKKNPIVALANLLAVLRCSWIFHRAIVNFGPTHIHLGSPLAYSYLSLALKIHTTPMVYRMGDAPPTDSPFNLRIWRNAIHRTTHLVSNSEYVRRTAIQAGAPDATVIYNLAPSCNNEQQQDKKFVDKLGDIRLIYVGAVAEHKGLVPLVEALAGLALDYPNLHLDIVGGSRYDTAFRKHLQALISDSQLADRVTFHGQVIDPSPFYQRAAIHLAPSMWEEPAANVVFEAKCAGTPSIIFPSGGLPEMVHHQVDGYICREKSADALVEGLRWMLADPVRLSRMGEAARTDFTARFGLERFAREWEAIYNSVEGAQP